MATWVRLHKVPAGREVDVNLDRVAVLMRDLEDEYTTLGYGSWHVNVAETPDQIHALAAPFDAQGRPTA